MSEIIEVIDRQALIDFISRMPSENIRKGFWLKTCSPCGDGKVYECFNCGSDVRECEAESYHYCPWCGALTYGIKEVEDE